MIWIRSGHAEDIPKHGGGLLEGYAMLAKVIVCLARIPFELHS